MSLPTWPISRQRAWAAGRLPPTTTSSRRSPTSSSPGPAIFIPDKYTSKGKWMDGWESRRRRVPGHDWCIVAARHARHRARRQRRYQSLHRQLSVALFDRSGRHGPRRRSRSMHATEGAPWTTLLEKIGAARQRRQLLRDRGSPSVDAPAVEHLSRWRRGAVARLRRSGGGLGARRAASGRHASSISLASRNGGLFLDASDMHYGTRGALLMPDRAKNMGDGWETKRRRGPGLRLGDSFVSARPGIVSKIEIDTNHYKGNYPDRASLEGCLAPGASPRSAPQRRRGQ